MLNASGNTCQWIYFTCFFKHKLDHWNAFYTAESYHALNLIDFPFCVFALHWWEITIMVPENDDSHGNPLFPGLSQLETNFQTNGLRWSWWKCAVQWTLMIWFCSCELWALGFSHLGIHFDNVNTLLLLNLPVSWKTVERMVQFSNTVSVDLMSSKWQSSNSESSNFTDFSSIWINL